MPSIPQTYTVSDLIEWSAKKQLILSPDFQRGTVWAQSAKVFLIDTILNDLPMPQIFFRTKIDTATQGMVREVVDGQQRLRSILDFANGKLKLTIKAPKHKGLYYKDLDESDKENFLSYKVPAVQLINTTDAEILEVFARLNSYSVKVTPAELRHAQFSEPVKFAIHEASREWSSLWTEYKVVSTRDSVRLKNDSVMAEMFMIIDGGLADGGEPSITKYYKLRRTKDEDFFNSIRKKVDDIISRIIQVLGTGFKDTTFFDAPNFLMLFSAISYLTLGFEDTPATEGVAHFKRRGVDWEGANEKLVRVAQSFDAEDGGLYQSFVSNSKSTTHRVSTRKPRFQTLVELLAA